MFAGEAGPARQAGMDSVACWRAVPCLLSRDLHLCTLSQVCRVGWEGGGGGAGGGGGTCGPHPPCGGRTVRPQISVIETSVRSSLEPQQRRHICVLYVIYDLWPQVVFASPASCSSARNRKLQLALEMSLITLVGSFLSQW